MIQNNIKFRQRNSGFTIVELLVVIVVIAILAAITIVAYTGITDRAKASQAASNAASVAAVADTYYADCSSYPSVAQLSTGCTTYGTAVAKLPAGVTAIASSSGALTTANFTANVIYVIKSTTGACIANYDPSYTTAIGVNFTNIKVTLLGNAVAFSANPNTGVATCT